MSKKVTKKSKKTKTVKDTKKTKATKPKKKIMKKTAKKNPVKKRAKSLKDRAKALGAKPEDVIGPQASKVGKPLDNLQWELFCQFYVSSEFWQNATQSYGRAYQLKMHTKRGCKTAGVNGSRLLGIARIRDRIDELLGATGLTDNFVDGHLAYCIAQYDHLPTKVAGVKEYNRMNERASDSKNTVHNNYVTVGMPSNGREPKQND